MQIVAIHKVQTKDRCGGLAAEIAFFAVLGLFPAVLVLAAALFSSPACQWIAKSASSNRPARVM